MKIEKCLKEMKYNLDGLVLVSWYALDKGLGSEELREKIQRSTRDCMQSWAEIEEDSYRLGYCSQSRSPNTRSCSEAPCIPEGVLCYDDFITEICILRHEYSAELIRQKRSHNILPSQMSYRSGACADLQANCVHLVALFEILKNDTAATSATTVGCGFYACCFVERPYITATGTHEHVTIDEWLSEVEEAFL